MQKHDTDAVALIVFGLLFGLVTVLGFFAARWRRGDLGTLDEWGLGGRRFGTVVTWFLLGGDLYTAYTFIAVPALVFGAGAQGFFALPYTLIVYPLVFHAAGKALPQKDPPGALIPRTTDAQTAYATLALGSAMALFLYPHALTGALSSQTANTVRRNAAILPAYSLVLGLIALLGYMAIAAGIQPASPNDA